MSRPGRWRPLSTHPAVRLEPGVILKASPWIRRFAWRMGVERCDMDDVTQEVIIRAWRASEKGRYRPPPGKPASRALIGWLWGITWRAVLSGRRREVPCGLRIRVPVQRDEEARLDALAVLGAVASLREPERSAVVLTAFGYDIHAVARFFRAPDGTAAGRIRRGRRWLCRALHRKGW